MHRLRAPAVTFGTLFGRFSAALVPALALSLAFSSLSAAEGAAEAHKVRVFRVFSGDSLLLRERGRSWRARLAGIEAPAVDTPEGQASRQILEKMVRGKRVLVQEAGPEEGGFVPVKMQFERFDINAEMLRAGAARARDADPGLLAAEAEAREKGLGIWAAGGSPARTAD